MGRKQIRFVAFFFGDTVFAGTGCGGTYVALHLPVCRVVEGGDFSWFFAGHNRVRGSGRVGSEGGRNFAGRVASGQELFINVTGRVGSP